MGFVPPVTAEDVRPELDRHVSAIRAGHTRLLVAHTPDGRIAGTAFLGREGHRLKRHRCWLSTVMLHPQRQGHGYGRALMAFAEETARAMDGVEAVLLTCRGGLGLEHFYASCGYKEVGRIPAAIKVAEGDLRDDVFMWLPLQ